MVKAARIKREEAPDWEAVAASSSSLAPTPSTPVVPVMTGTIFHALDEKGRVIIPAKLRPALTEQFWMMLDENDNIAIYNYQTGLDVLEHCERMMADHPGDEDIAAAVERITGAADLVKVESNWRVQVSELLRFHAQLDKEIVTVGVLNHAVIWSRERWEAAQARRLHSQEVRRAQAGMLRAAASGIKNSASKKGSYEQAKAEKAETGTSASTSGTAAGTGIDAGGSTVTATSSAGDGKRGPRVFTLSQVGR